MLRPELLGLASLGCTMAVLGNAYVKHEQFYPSVVYITKSNPSMAIIYIQFLVIVILMGKIVRKIFFGQLRPAEFEHLMDRSWYAVTETCLAFTVFKDDLSPKFVALFVLLLFLKSFHWLSEDRVDFMERSPSISLLFHVRVLSLCIFLGTLDIIFIQHACHSAMTKGASVQLVFGFEYAIHLTIILNTLIKYILHTIDLNSDAPWENKAVYMLYLELFIGFIKVILYMFFFMIMMRIFTLPLFALRPMYLTMRAFKKALNDVVLSRRAIQLLNTSFPFATEEDLENSDNVCIICRETMTASACKKLPCGHIFHRSCLRGWFLRQQTCPTCRMDIVRPGQNTAQPQQAGAGGVQGAAANNFQQQVAALRQQLDALQQQRQQQQQQQLPNILNNLLQQQQANLGGQAPAMPQTLTSTAAPPGPAPPTVNPGQTPEMGAGAVPGAGSPSMAGRHPPFIPLPPFMMPVIPPPMPPPNFQGMSEEELREMEGSEREHVEARIRCLRNIQVLLDAAVTEMQQYSSVVARCNAQQTVGRASSVSNSPTPVSVSNNSTSSLTKVSSSTVTTVTSSGGVGPSTSSSSATEVSPSPSSSSTFARNLAAAFSNTGARPKVREQETVEETIIAEDSVDSSNSTSEKLEPVTPVAAETSIISSPAAASQSANPFETLSQEDDQDEIRRRRLAVFEEKKKQLLRK